VWIRALLTVHHSRQSAQRRQRIWKQDLPCRFREGYIILQTGARVLSDTYKEDGVVNLKYWGGDTRELLYEKDIYQKDVVTEEMEMASRPDFTGKTKVVSASSKYGLEKGRLWLGANYRDTWSVPIEVPYFDIKREYSGLEIVKRSRGR